MAEPSLSEVFGNNATQDPNVLTIKKSDLEIVGLSPSANNSAESLIVAIVMLAARNLTEITRAQDLINRHVTVNYSGQDLIDQGGNYFQRDAYSVLLYKARQLATVDPDDY